MITISRSYLIKTIRITVTCFVGLLIFGLSGCGGDVEKTNFDLTTDKTLDCTPPQISEWEFVQGDMLGVAGRDPVGEEIGLFDVFEDRPWPAPNNNWRPYLTSKQTLCGTLFHFNFHDTGGNEDDWNNYIIPSPNIRFSSLLYFATNYADDLGEFHTCGSDVLCMEAEITPTQEFYLNPWFPRIYGNDLDSSFLEGQYLCAYGPYVGDFRHGGRPEIHPSELIWFEYPQGTTTLMALHDDSERFNFPSEFGFDDSNPAPDNWHPWAETPRTAEFNLAFEFTINPFDENTPLASPLEFDISEAAPPYGQRPGTSEFPDGFVVTSLDPDARRDADDGTDHAITYNGQTGLIVHEKQANDNDIGVQFTNVCKTPGPFNTTRLQGYVTLTSKISRNDDGGEGFHVLQVQKYREENQNASINLETQTVGALGKIEPETIHTVTVEGTRQILSDVRVSLISSSDAKNSDRKIIKAELVTGEQRQEFIFREEQEPGVTNEVNETSSAEEAKEQELSSYVPQGVIENVPVAKGGTVELTMESGKTLYISIPPVSLAPDIYKESPQEISRDTTTWNSMIAAADGNLDTPIQPPDQLQRVSQWQLDIFPSYAPLKDGQVSAEDDAPVAEVLNEIIDRADAARIEEFFGAARPFDVEWLFEGRNLTTGEIVSVNSVGNASDNEIQVNIVEDVFFIESLQVVFPETPENTIFELVITAKMSDTMGNTGEIQHTLWSHILTDQNNNRLVEYIIPTVATLAGVSPQEIQAAERREVPADETMQILSDPKRRAAVMLRAMTTQFAMDQRITISELAALIRGAKLFASQ